MRRLTLLLTFFALTAAGCRQREPLAEVVLFEGGELLSFQPIGQGTNATLTADTVARTAEAWAALQTAFQPRQPFRPVDFPGAMVIVAADSVPTGGYSVHVESVERDSLGVLTTYTLLQPCEESLATAVIQQPFQAVVVRHLDAPVRFVRRVERLDCRM